MQLTFNEEINPATFTASQVTLTGPGGSISGVTVTAVAGSNNHQFTISFPAQTAAGAYTLTVGPRHPGLVRQCMNQNRNGVNGEASDAFVGNILRSRTPATATFVKHGHDDARELDRDLWRAGQRRHRRSRQLTLVDHRHAQRPVVETWTTSTTAPQALQNPGGTGRIEAAWYSATSFTVNVNLTDGQAHDLGCTRWT